MEAEKLASRVLYEDNHLLIVNKPAGYLVQGDSTGDQPLVEYYKQFLKQKYQKPGNVFLGVVHRLDRPVSGVLVFAKTSKALSRMNKLFQQREVNKIYWAIVGAIPPDNAGILKHWIVKDRRRNISRTTGKNTRGAQFAELTYRMLRKHKNNILLEVEPHTGRPHQIRVQLSAMGCPIRGDLKYGADRPNKDGNIDLHAKMIKFTHPVKKERMYISAPIPDDDIWQHFKGIKEGK